MMRTPTVITGTAGLDTHVVGTKVLSRALREAGFHVVELSCQTSTDEFIHAAIETKADAILVSSLYGMAELDLRDFKQSAVEAGLGDVILYVGGMLAVGRHDFREDEEKFKRMGFDRVYPPNVDLDEAISDLWNDLKARGKA
jgi:methylaspartate mutase S subunit